MKLIFAFAVCFLLFSCGNSGDSGTTVKHTSENIDSLYTSYKKQGKTVPMDILIKHGNHLLDTYKYAEALRDGAEAYRREPSNVDARLLYAKCLNNKPQRTHSDRLAAQKHFKFILKKQPKNLEVLIQLAARYAEMGDDQNAFFYCNEALRIDKHYRDAYILKGKIYDSGGNSKMAISSFETAIQQDPDFFPAYLYLGEIYQYDKQDTMAIEYFLSAEQIEPNNIEILYKLAYAYQYFGKYESATNVYRRMQTVDPKFAVSWFQIGWIKQFGEKQIDSALHYYNITTIKEPQYVEAWHNMGLIYEENKKDKYEAIKCYRQAVKYNKDFDLSVEALKRLSN